MHGRQIRVVAYDDAYDPPRCLANTQKLIVEDQVFSLFCYLGTPTSVKIMPLVQEARIPLVGVFSGAQALRNPFQPYIINIRASYYQETGAVVRELVENLDLEKIAVFYQYDDYGFDGLTGTQIALKRYGLTPVATGHYRRGSREVEGTLAEIIPSGAQAVIMIGTYDPCAKFIRLARSRGFDPIFHCVSFVGADELLKRLGSWGEGVIITQVVPPPSETLLLPAAEDYTNLLARYYPEDDPSFLEVCSAILSQSGYRVDTVTNTTDGLARMRDQPPDLLILDIMMATMDEGLNFATALKKQEDLAKIPIMIVSARPEVEKGYKRSIEQDMDWISAEIFMEKPIKPDDLLYNVRLLLKE